MHSDLSFFGATLVKPARALLATGLLALAALHGAALAAPSEYKVLHSFASSTNTESPNGMDSVTPPVFGRDGKLYGLISVYYNRGLTSIGFPTSVYTDPVTGQEMQGRGCIFYRLDPDTGAYQALAEFDNTAVRFNTSMYSPSGDRTSYCMSATQAANGDWYGATPTGGSNYSGQIWRYSGGSKVDIVYNFPAFSGPQTEGVVPNAPLLKGADDTFYGVARQGGANAAGTIFKFKPGQGLAVVHNFARWTFGNEQPTPGWEMGAPINARSLILSRDGKTLFGASYEDWFQRNPGVGTLFVMRSGLYRVGVDGNDFKQLALYPALQGIAFSPSSLVQAAGSDDLLGVSPSTNEQRYEKGQFFRFHADTGVTEFLSTSLPALDPGGGSSPEGLSIAADGQIYGTFLDGSSNGSGSVFRLKPDGSHEVIYMLAAKAGDLRPEGARPTGGFMAERNGVLYGITLAGGPSNAGVIYSIRPGDRIAPGITLSLVGSGLSTNVPNYPDPYTIVLNSQAPQSVTLRWGSVQGQNCSSGADWPNRGPVAPSGTITITPTAVGNYVYTVQCENSETPGQVFSASLALKVLPAATPVQQVGNGGGGSLPAWLLMPLALLGLWRALSLRRFTRASTTSTRSPTFSRS